MKANSKEELDPSFATKLLKKKKESKKEYVDT